MIRASSPLPPESHLEVTLRARPLGIDTYQEPVVYMRWDCAVCRSEGFASQSRVRLSGKAPGELVYALGYLSRHADLMRIRGADEEETS
jgi:hypothetical protein